MVVPCRTGAIFLRFALACKTPKNNACSASNDKYGATVKGLYGGAFGSKMQLDRNLHPIGSYCMLFVRELYAIRSCPPFYRTGHSVVLHIRSYSPFGRTEHSVVLPIRSFRAFGRTPVVVGHGSQSIMGELSFRAQFQRVLVVCGPRAATNFNYQKYKSG